MLKSLHQLQVENRRLEEQIKNLTAKKERLQLLNAQLSVPFPAITTNPSPSHQMHTYTAQAGEYHSTVSKTHVMYAIDSNWLPVTRQRWEVISEGQR